MKAYRFQDKNREIEALLDPEQQFSYPWDLSLEETDAVRHGISACESLADLAAYVACSGLLLLVEDVQAAHARHHRRHRVRPRLRDRVLQLCDYVLSVDAEGQAALRGLLQ